MSSEGYPADWNSRRKEVYQRDDYTCQNCGVKGGHKGNAELHAHHIVPKSKGGTHKKSNLKTICKECHNAIHGDSMAPSVDNRRGSTDIEFPVDVDRFPYTVSEYVECLNTIAEIEKAFSKFADTSGDLVEYASAYQELDGDVPERVERQYEDTREKANSILGYIQKNIETLQEWDTSEYDSSTKKELSTFLNVADDLVTDTQEYVDLVHEKATADSFTESDYYDLQFHSDEISETEFGDTTASVYESVASEIYDTLAEMDEFSHWGSTNSEWIEVCPLCKNETEHLSYTREEFDVDFDYTRCRNCKSEWVNGDRTITMTNNTEGIEKLSLDTAVWTRIRKDNDELSTKVDHYQQLSDSLVRKKKTLVYGSASVYIVFLIWAVSFQLFTLLFIGFIIFLVFLIGTVKLLNHRVKTKSQDGATAG